LSWLLLRASALASEGPSRSYPFGREAFTPFVIGIQGFVLLATLLYAVIGFAIMGLLTGSAWDRAAPYVDPVMVLVTCALFVWAPIAMVRTTLLELLERVPPDEIRMPVQAAIDVVGAHYELDPPDVRITKLGPKLYVEIEGVVSPTVTVLQEFEFREALRRRLDALPYDVWLNVESSPRGYDSWAGQGSNL